MSIKNVEVELTGITPLLLHYDNIDWCDRMELWKNDPKNKKLSKAGDDRTPSWRWIGCLTTDGTVITIPSEYIMCCIMRAAAEVPTGKRQQTFKSISQSGLLVTDFHWPLLVKGKTVAMKDINELIDDELKFHDQMEMVQGMGFELFVKRATIGNAKHIRVRPKFPEWSVSGTVTLLNPIITKEIIQQIMEIAGQYKGLGDWRPGGKTPGQHGMFTARVK